MRGTRFWTAAVAAVVVLGAVAVPANGLDRSAGSERVVLDGDAVAEDATRTWTGVAVEVTPLLRASLGLDRGVPDHVVADVWADGVTAGLNPAEKALLATGGGADGLEVLVDARTGRYLAVDVPDAPGVSTLAITTGQILRCTTLTNRSCIDRGPFRFDVTVNGTGTSTASFASSQKFTVRRGGSASFTVTYSGGSSSRQSWPANSSVSWSAPGVTVSRISH